MKKEFYIILFCCVSVFSQSSKNQLELEANFLRGNILAQTDKLNHLISGHPEGIIISFSKKTDGSKSWHKLFNYPEYGVYFLHQDFKNQFLGKNYAFGGHYNFYFLKRNLQFKIATGIAVTSNPYDKVTNSKNNAFGTKLLSNIDFGFTYKKTHVISNFGFQAGLLLTHYSNGRIKSPNSGINVYNLNIGVNYSLNHQPIAYQDSTKISIKYTEPLHYNVIFKTGINESTVPNSGQHAFYHLGFFADKRINKKSSLQFGSDLFLSNYLKNYIQLQAVAYPENDINPEIDYKRAGLFLGHELHINKLSFVTQVGVYVYNPSNFDLPIYDRLAVKYKINKTIFTEVSLKTHLLLAEALEFGIGIRL